MILHILKYFLISSSRSSHPLDSQRKCIYFTQDKIGVFWNFDQISDVYRLFMVIVLQSLLLRCLLFIYLYIICQGISIAILLNSHHKLVYSTSNILVKVMIKSRNYLCKCSGPITDTFLYKNLIIINQERLKCEH